jgi:protein SCO1/2
MLRELAAAGVAMALLVCNMAVASAQGGSSSRHEAGADQPARSAPRYLLMDPQGRAVTNEDFRGRFQLVTFGFVSCPDVCPTTLLQFKTILQSLGDKAGRLQPIFVTIDPERDTREILRAYTGSFDSRILGLTGSLELVRRAAETFRVQFEKVREPGARPDIYTMNHTAGMFLLDPDGILLATFPYEMPADEISRRIGVAIASGSFR